MNFEISGKLLVKEDIQQITDRFKKREFVIEVENERNPEWNDFIKFQLTQDRCDLIETIDLNANIKVSFNVRGRKWEKDGQVNYFSNLEAWRIQKVDGNPIPAAPEYNENDIPPPVQEDDLPF